MTIKLVTEPEQDSAPSALEAKRSESILALLADLRARAERGEILTLAVAYETNEQTFGHEIVGRGDQIAWGIIGELELAKVSVMIKMGRLKPPGG